MSTLTVTTRENYPAFLIKAIEIVNLMLQYFPVAFEFNSALGANRVTAKHLEDVEVRFAKPESAIYGWTDRSKNAKIIYVNEILRDRISKINQRYKSHEYRCIVFMIAVVILHECAHLTLRWKGILDTPDKFFGEIGDYTEMTLFHGLVKLKIQKSTSAISRTRNAGKWTSSMEILDVVVCNLDRMREMKCDHLKKFFTKGNLRKKCLFPVDVKPYKNIKGATVHLGDNRKRKRHCEIESNVMILGPIGRIAPPHLCY
jgi:cell division protein ZapA (FtsZ GTPase activity inhibitor)